jgi:hypothetical protein
MPKVAQEYNSHMGGVDLLYKQISLYCIRIRSKMLDAAVVNTWRAYQTANKEDSVSLLDVRKRIVLAYLNKN